MRSRFRPSHSTVIAYLALFVALGGTAVAANGGNFILGQPNSASSTTSLTAPVAGKGLQVTNTSTGAGATALGLNVASGHPPFTVNSGTKVTNLNADKLDGKDSTNWRMTRVIDNVGALPLQGSFTSSGGKLLIMASGSGYRSSSNTSAGLIGMNVFLDGNAIDDVSAFTNEKNSHKAFVPNYMVVSGISAGSHTITLQPYNSPACGSGDVPADHCTTTDSGDYFEVAVTEIP